MMRWVFVFLCRKLKNEFGQVVLELKLNLRNYNVKSHGGDNLGETMREFQTQANFIFLHSFDQQDNTLPLIIMLSSSLFCHMSIVS